VASCVRCGTFLCGACIELLGEAASCASCLALLHRGAVSPRVVKGIIALNVIGLVSFPLCLLFPPVFNLTVAVLGLWVATRELRRIRASGMVARGLGVARLVFGVGVANGLLSLLWVAALIYAFFRGNKW
jgi:hypothetical protein